MNAAMKAPHTALGLAIVIPCHHEPDILSTLQSLAACTPSRVATEVIVVLNTSVKHGPEVQQCHQERLQDLRSWQKSPDHVAAPFELLVIDAPDLPPKHAGVGLARRLGMDLAAERFAHLQTNGLIVNLDADCTVATNYFTAIEQHFEQNPHTPAASIYYEHPLSGSLPPELYTGIVWYELFLRYYVHALAYAGLPCAFQTIGSAMAVRADIYRKMGGMNRRKAGEDFYFLQKIIERGDFSNLTRTTVYPSPRLSDRVPFGTGKAIGDWLNEPDSLRLSYALQSFKDLRKMSQQVPALYPLNSAGLEAIRQQFSPVLSEWLAAEGWNTKMAEIQANTTGQVAFQKRFYQWFNGFKAMKCVHALRDQAYGEQPLCNEARELLLIEGHLVPAEASPVDLLQIYRQIDQAQVN